LSNVILLREASGELGVFVGSERIQGIGAINVGSGLLGLAIPLVNVRFAEAVPFAAVSAAPLETKDNVLAFPKLQAALDEGDAE
jgi:hypothetical protein